MSIDPVNNVLRQCELAENTASQWFKHWSQKSPKQPDTRISIAFGADSKLDAMLRRALLHRHKASPEAVEHLFAKLSCFCESFRPAFSKKTLSTHWESDLIVLDNVCSALSILKSNVVSSTDDIPSFLNRFTLACESMREVLFRRESATGGKEPDQTYPAIIPGKYAKGFIKFADQNVGLVVFADQQIQAFHIGKAAKAAWGTLRALIETDHPDGWTRIDGNVRGGFIRTTSGNDCDRVNDVVRINRYIHAETRGHTSNHMWRICSFQYAQTEHI